MDKSIRAEDVNQIKIIGEDQFITVFDRFDDLYFEVRALDCKAEAYCSICMSPYDPSKKVCPSCKGQDSPLFNTEDATFDTYDDYRDKKCDIYINGDIVQKRLDFDSTDIVNRI